MILLDTNAAMWLLVGSPRGDQLLAQPARLYLSPVSLLEMKFLLEAGKLRPLRHEPLTAVAEDPRWQLDDPSSNVLFNAALDLDWTRDPFDRLLVAHARFRGWRLATGDRRLLARLGSSRTLQL